MLLAEIIHTCSHSKVAEAAITSIGPDTAREVERIARERGLNAGEFVADAVQKFAHEADAADWNGLARRIEGADMPVLAGLLHILETTLSHHGAHVPFKLRGASPVVFDRDRTAHLSCCA